MILSDKALRNEDVGGPPLGNVYWEADVKQAVKELMKLGICLSCLKEIFGEELTDGK